LLDVAVTMKISRLAVLLLAVPLAACTVGGTGGDDGDDGDDGVTPGDLDGSITADRSVSGMVSMTNDVIVEPGVTLTIAAGSMLEVATGKTLRVRGTLAIEGAAGSEVTILPTTGNWAGIVAEAGSTVTASYVTGMDVANVVFSHMGSTTTLDHVTMTEVGHASVVQGMVTITRSRFEGISGVSIHETGHLDVSDTYFVGTAGDTVVQTGGTLIMAYTNVGNTATTGDHCAMHLNEGSHAEVTYSNISDTSVGLMIGGNVGSTFTFSNFQNELNLQDISSGVPNSGGSFDSNYITGTPPTIPGMPITNPAGAPIATAGPRP
jgi:hypothetical protein